jgi:predicted nucleotidyltransferase
MSEFKDLIYQLRDNKQDIQKILKFVISNPVEISKMPDDTYVINDGNHRANLLNLLNVKKIPSIVNGDFKLIPTEILRRPNGSIGTQGFTAENMTKLINHILSKESELEEDKELDKKIISSFESKDHLCYDIFRRVDSGYEMKENIRKRLLEIANNFIESIDVDFFIHDIILTGSLANFNWSEFSDVDLHILLDMDEFDNSKKTDSKILHNIVKEFFNSKKNVWNKDHNIKIKGFDVELYVQDIDEEHISSGVYSILHNKWLVEPQKVNTKIDDRKILEKGEEYAKQIDDLVSNSDDKDIVKKIDDLKNKIKKFRQSGLEDGGEYSYENLTFKLLRRNGYIEKLLNLKSTAIDKKLSLPQ